jgi:hypothetical protein
VVGIREPMICYIFNVDSLKISDLRHVIRME